MARGRSIKGKKLPAKQLQQVILKTLAAQPKKRLHAKQLIKKLKIANSRSSVQDALEALAAKGQITHVKDGKFRSARKGLMHDEPVESHHGYMDLTRSGAGYVICDTLDQDVYVPARRTMKAMNGDRVVVQLGKRYGKRLEGVVTKILERSTDRFVGTFRWSKNFAFVVPENDAIPFDIYVHPEHQAKAQEGDVVLVSILSWPDNHRQSPTGKVERIFDADDGHEIKMESILSDHGFSMDFPPLVEKQAADLVGHISAQEISRRRDMRKTVTFTIDPVNAKDFDDAISFRMVEDGRFEVGIHIADVTHYVKPNSAIDKEALKRATSVYLVDRTAPMLPEVLSNELCSLRPDEDSLTFSAVFEMDKNAKVKSRWFGKTIIHSDKRFTYEEAQEVLDSGQGPLHQELSIVARLSRKLRKKRLGKGGISFNSTEYQFELDDQKKPIAIKAKVQQETNALIEDLMLLANREVAHFLATKSQPPIPLVFRVHDEPDPQKLAEYAIYLMEFGFDFKHDTPEQIRQSFAQLHEQAKTDEHLLFAEKSAVRTMAKAVYSPENIGHFGLGFEHYAHFTSPIRRYADVMVHRILEYNLMGDFRADKVELEARSKHISNQERKATDAERTSVKFKQIEFIKEFIGEEFEGVVSGFIDSGMFVTLLDSGVDGLVGFDKLGEVFEVPENRLSARANKSGTRYRVGDKVRVKVIEARLESSEVDFDIVS
ncbi:MAG: ribonuclease R [Saprospiraceae bacterium]|nr:ribonuclease R [Saprospiraceae bacterium]